MLPKHIDKLDSLRLSKNGTYEPMETACVKLLLKPGQTFVDIGAHIGYYTLLAAEIVGPKGRVFAFEPDPENFALLEANIKAAGVEEYVVAVNAAIGLNHGGKSELYLSRTNSGDHRLFATPGRTHVEVPVLALDRYLSYGDVDFIKCDTQGYEWAVLAGARNLLQKCPAKIYMLVEFYPSGLCLSGSSGANLLALLEELGFHYSIPRMGRVAVRADEVLNLFPDSTARHTNLLCYRETERLK